MTSSHPVGTVLFADVIASRQSPETAARLRAVVATLDDHFAGLTLAAFGFTQGDELQGLLVPGADPFAGILRVTLDSTAPPLRWVVAHGTVDSGTGPATERSGPAFVRARALIDKLGRTSDGLAIGTGNHEWDPVLEDLAPVFVSLLTELTPRQRDLARLALVEGRSQARIAEETGVTRQTVSKTAERAKVREIDGMARALAHLYAVATNPEAGA